MKKSFELEIYIDLFYFIINFYQINRNDKIQTRNQNFNNIFLI